MSEFSDSLFTEIQKTSRNRSQTFKKIKNTLSKKLKKISLFFRKSPEILDILPPRFLTRPREKSCSASRARLPSQNAPTKILQHIAHAFSVARRADKNFAARHTRVFGCKTCREKFCNASHARFRSQNAPKKNFAAHRARVFRPKTRRQKFCNTSRMRSRSQDAPRKIFQRVTRAFGCKTYLTNSATRRTRVFGRRTRPEKFCSASRARLPSQNAPRKKLRRIARAFSVAKRADKNIATSGSHRACIFGRKTRREKFYSASHARFRSQNASKKNYAAHRACVLVAQRAEKKKKEKKNLNASCARFWSQNVSRKILQRVARVFLFTKRVEKNFAARRTRVFGRETRQ